MLQRIAHPQPDAPLTTKQNLHELNASILSHLKKMLNTRQGHVLTQPEYGMPDITEFILNLPEAVHEVSEAIRSSIERFEPRLISVTVNHLPSEYSLFSLRFEITAALVTDVDEASVRFETELTPSGQIEVRD